MDFKLVSMLSYWRCGGPSSQNQLKWLLFIFCLILHSLFSLKKPFSVKKKKKFFFALYMVDKENLAWFWHQANHRFFISFLAHSYWAEFWFKRKKKKKKCLNNGGHHENLDLLHFLGGRVNSTNQTEKKTFKKSFYILLQDPVIFKQILDWKTEP